MLSGLQALKCCHTWTLLVAVVLYAISVPLMFSDVLHPSIIPDIKADYVEVKGEFVNACTAQGTPPAGINVQKIGGFLHLSVCSRNNLLSETE